MSLLPSTEAPIRLKKIPPFHLQMGIGCAAILIVSVVGCALTSVRVPNVGGIAIALVLIFAAVSPLPLYWHQKGKIALRDASLTIPWGFLLAAILPFPVAVAARLGMHMDLKDAYFMHLDQLLGVRVPGIAEWGSHHWLGRAANISYGLLGLLIPMSFLLPALTGRFKHAQQMLTGNLIVFAIGLPLFCLLPAVGPWYGYHLAANPTQLECQKALFDLRHPGLYVYQLEGVVCFPSFHAIWVILCARALWCFRWLRIPVSILSGLILLSTMTTGWHYFVDVLAGSLLAIATILVAKSLPA